MGVIVAGGLIRFLEKAIYMQFFKLVYCTISCGVIYFNCKKNKAC